MEIHSHGGWKQTTKFSLPSWMWILEFMLYDYGQNQWAKHRWQAAVPADRPHLSCVANHRAFQETFCWHRTYTDPWYGEYFRVRCDSERTFKNSHMSVAQTGQPTACKFGFYFVSIKVSRMLSTLFRPREFILCRHWDFILQYFSQLLIHIVISNQGHHVLWPEPTHL